ncbi:MAG: hypothetical protein ACP5KE_00615 [Candidatus Methanodesulfokora sp.]|jgi:hypothetical protein|nr:MAG: hypothetical protein C0200_01880 [Candidatus Korarchaeota archaeon]
MYEEDLDKMRLFQLYKKAYTDITERDIEIEDVSGWFYLVNIPKMDLKIAAVILEAVPESDANRIVTELVDRIKDNLGDEFESTYVHIWTTSAYRDKLEEIVAEKGYENVSIELMDELIPTSKKQVLPRKRDIEMRKETKRADEVVIKENISKERTKATQDSVMVPVDVLNKVLDTQKSLAETLDRVAHLLERLLSREVAETNYVAKSITSGAAEQEIARKPALKVARKTVIEEKIVEREEKPIIQESIRKKEERIVESSEPQVTKGADEFIDEYVIDNPWAEILSKKVRKNEGKSS